MRDSWIILKLLNVPCRVLYGKITRSKCSNVLILIVEDNILVITLHLGRTVRLQ